MEKLQHQLARSSLKENVRDYLPPAKPYSATKQPWQSILEKLNQLECAMQAANQQPYAFLRTNTREAFEKYLTQVMQDKSLQQVLQQKASPTLQAHLQKVIEKELHMER